MSSWKRTLYACWLAQVFSITGFAFVFPFMPLYIRSLGVTERAEVIRWAGIADSATAVTMALFAPVWGSLADRFGRKPMVLRSMIGGAAVLSLMGFCRTVGQLVVCRLLQGVLTGTVTASVALVASAAPRERSGYALGMMHVGVLVGVSIGPFFGGAMAEVFGFRAAFLIAGALLLAGGLLVKFAVEEHFTPAMPGDGAARGSFGEVLAAGGFLAAVFALFTIQFANSAPAPIFPLFIEKLRSTSERIKVVTGSVVSVGGVAAALSAGVFGRFSDAWGHKRVLVATTAFAALVSILHLFVQSVGHLVALRALLGLGAAGMMPAANAIIRDITAERNLGRAFGVTSSLACAGMALGPLAGAYLGRHYTLRTPFVLTGVVLGFAAGLVLWRVQRDRPAPATAELPRPTPNPQ